MKRRSMIQLVRHVMAKAVLILGFIGIPFILQAQTVTLNYQNKPLEIALKSITDQTGYKFVYSNSVIDTKQVVSVNVSSSNINTLLNELFKNTPIVYRIVNKQIALSLSRENSTPPQQKESPLLITGKVTEADTGSAMDFVTVYVSDQNDNIISSTATNANGEFTITSNSPHSDRLGVRFVGYEPQLIGIKGRNTINVVLQTDIKTIDEVVVIGYGTTSAKDLTGAVSTVGKRQLENLNATNVSSLLQNLASGVQVSQSTGRPGERVNIRVRGATSFGSNDPLYIVDGVPIESYSLIESLSPGDIQSMDVLKDASAAAIYGSRAANGVIIITTTKGVISEKPTISFNYNSTIDTEIRNFRILTGDEWRNTLTGFARQTLVYDPSNKEADEIVNTPGQIFGDADTNWFDEIKQPAWRHNADFSIRGGSKTNKYMISLAVLDQTGMVRGDDLTRYTGRVSLDTDILPVLRFGINTNLGYMQRNVSGTSMFTSQGFRPDLPVYDENGNYDMSTGAANPVANTHIKNRTDTYNFLGTIYGELDIIPDLTFRSSLSGTVYSGTKEGFSPSFLYRNKRARGSEYHSNNFSTVFDNTLSYKKKFADIHSIDAVVGVSFENYESKSTYISGDTYPDDYIYNNIGSATSTTVDSESGYKSSKGLFASFGRINYRLKDRYLFTVTTRYDGSSLFGANNRYGFFPSGAIAWRISEEPFMENVEFVNDLKIRMSAGVTGVTNIGLYRNLDLYSAGSYNDLPMIYHSQSGNKDIKWEQTTQRDIGVDFVLFDSRLRGSVSGYIKDSKDLIWNFNYSNSSKGYTVPRNIASVKNRGVELNLTGYIIQNKDWQFDVTLNVTRNVNKITKLVPEGAYTDPNGVLIHGSGQQVLALDKPMGAFFGYEYNGIIQTQKRVDELNALAKSKGFSYYDGNMLRPGHLELKDLNGDGRITADDRTVIGDPNPRFYGGVTTNLAYKSFSLFANFGFQSGGKKIYGQTLQNVPAQLTGLIDYGLNDRWNDNHKDAKYPALYIGDGVPKMTSLSLHSTTHLRLQELRIAYRLPEFNKYMNAQIYVSGTNLFTISPYPGTDPATANYQSSYGGNYDTSYPGIRSFSFGLKFNL